MVAASTAVEVFCSYAHKDEAWRQKLETHLSLLRRQGLVSLWHDRLISPGTDWAHAIDIHLETASIILLFVSANFFDSDYCYGIEMQQALKRHEAGEARVIPLLVRPVDWRDAPFAHLQALPTDARPLSVWQDEDAALTDVVAGIRRVLEDFPLLTASAPRAALPAIWNIPYPRNPFFLGRESELAQVRQRLQAGQTTALSQPQAISGLGGIGKTQLALEYAYRYHQEYQAVLWAYAENTEALTSSYLTLAKLLRLPEQQAQKQSETIDAVKRWLQAHRGWLLILDNADDLPIVRDFLPPSMGGHLLLTTRATATRPLARPLEVETLPPEQGALLLLRWAGLVAPDASLEHASPQERELAMQITQELGGLPLALDQAGAYLEDTGAGLAEYWRIYQQHRAELLNKRRGLVSDHPDAVSTTFTLSFQKVEEKNLAAAELLRLCAFLAPDTIPEELLMRGAPGLGPPLEAVATDAFLLNQAIEALRAYSLVGRHPRAETLSVHRLVQVVLRDAMDTQTRKQWMQRVILIMNDVFPDVTYEMWERCQQYIPHVLACASLMEPSDLSFPEASRLLYQAGLYFSEHDRGSEAEPLLKRALAIREQVLGPEHPDTAQSLNGLGRLYGMLLGQCKQAEPLLKRALAIREQVLGPEHPDTAQSLNDLGGCYRCLEQTEQAEQLIQRAIGIYEHVFGPDHPTTAQSLRNLAGLYDELGRYEQAEQLLQRAHAIYENKLGSRHPTTVDCLDQMAGFYRVQGQYERAEELAQQVHMLREQILGPEHPDTARSLAAMGHLSLAQGQYKQAESLYERALDIRERVLGPEHPHTAHSYDSLAQLYAIQGQYTQAEQFMKRALAIYEKVYGPEHRETARTLDNLASLYRKQGQYEPAERLYQRILEIREQTLGVKHSETIDSLDNLASLYYDQGKYEQAEPLLQRALAIYEQQGESEPLGAATALGNLAVLYQDQDKFAEAESLYQRALRIREQQLGPAHPDTAEIVHDLAQLWEAQDKSEEASVGYTRALAIREQALGALHPETTETRTRLIALLHALGRHEQAAQLEMAQAES